jgi:poly(3-hydroxybutyrate) depolymerase
MGFVLLTPQGEDRTKEGFGWAWGKNAERSVEISIDIVRKAIHIDHKRIYLTGFSAGGALTYVMGLKYPQVFRGIAPLGAPFKREFMSENTKRFQVLETFRNLRVYIGLRALEKRFLSDAHLAVEVFRDLGAKVEFVSYEGVGHGLPEPKKNELIRILTFLDSKK